MKMRKRRGEGERRGRREDGRERENSRKREGKQSQNQGSVTYYKSFHITADMGRKEQHFLVLGCIYEHHHCYMATCSRSVSVPVVMYVIPGGSPTHQLHDPFLVVALHTNYMTYMTQITHNNTTTTLRCKTRLQLFLSLVEHSSVKSSQIRNTYSLRLPRPQVCMVQ